MTDLNFPPCSARLRLRPIQRIDIFWVSALISRPQVRELMLGKRSGGLEEAGEMIQSSLYLNQQQPGLGFWMMTNEKRYAVGLLSLLPGQGDELDMGVQLHPDFWGKWYGVEGGKLLSIHVFERLRRPSAFAHTHPGNLAAQATAKRVGFVDDSIVEYHGHAAQRQVLDQARYQQVNWRKNFVIAEN